MPNSLRIPKPLAPRSHIRIISPGLPTLAHMPDRARRADRALRNLGFELSYGAHAFSISEDGITAGTAEERAADFMEAFEDGSVDAILASDSGLGSREMIRFLDASRIAANAKPFIGYCDTIFLHHYLASEAGVSSLYGCVLMVHFGDGGGPFPETLEYFEHVLMKSAPLICRPLRSRAAGNIDWCVPELGGKPRTRDIEGGWTWLRAGQARGPLLGAEISILPDVICFFDLSLESTVLFWDVAYHGLDVQPLFKEVCDRVDLTRLAGMVVGAHPTIPPSEWASEVNKLLWKLLPGTEFPVLVNADLSHLQPPWIVPYGEEVILDDAQGVVFPRRAPAVRRLASAQSGRRSI
jgi:muramoyltetrapeptide carboxypeptidase